MDKLVERETATRNPLVAAPALAVQFFLIPLVVVGATVLVYVGFRSLLTDSRTAQDYLIEIQTGGPSRRWPAAYELSRLMNDPAVRADRALAPALIKAYESARSDEDPRVRRYPALAIGRPAAPPRARGARRPRAGGAAAGAPPPPPPPPPPRPPGKGNPPIPAIWALG